MMMLIETVLMTAVLSLAAALLRDGASTPLRAKAPAPCSRRSR